MTFLIKTTKNKTKKTLVHFGPHHFKWKMTDGIYSLLPTLFFSAGKMILNEVYKLLC